MKLAKYELADDWRRGGIEPGDIVMLHTSCKRTFQRYAQMRRSITPSDIFESFQLAVGDKGTLIFPTFNFGFCNGQPYDIRKTPSNMGVLTEVARRHPDAVRNGHPAYSFASIGKDAKAFGMDNKSGLGKGSPFDQLYKMDGRVSSLDLSDQDSVTFYHYVDETLEMPHRFNKSFTGSYTGFDGNTEMRTYDIYVRRRSQGVVTCLDKMEELVWAAEVWFGFHPGDRVGLRTCNATALFSVIAQFYLDGQAEGLTYYIDESTIAED